MAFVSRKHFWSLALLLLASLLLATQSSTMVKAESETEVARTDGSTPHSVHILYCVGWGMKSNFLKVKAFLEGQFPELRGNITGENYPIPPVLELVQNIVSMLQMVGMAWMVFGGETLFRMMGFSTPPSIFYTIQEYGTQVAIALFLLVPQLIGTFSTTGAFEIVLDNQKVLWSKLEQGRFPNADELTKPLIQMGLEQAQAS